MHHLLVNQTHLNGMAVNWLAASIHVHVLGDLQDVVWHVSCCSVSVANLPPLFPVIQNLSETFRQLRTFILDLKMKPHWVGRRAKSKFSLRRKKKNLENEHQEHDSVPPPPRPSPQTARCHSWPQSQILIWQNFSTGLWCELRRFWKTLRTKSYSTRWYSTGVTQRDVSFLRHYVNRLSLYQVI